MKRRKKISDSKIKKLIKLSNQYKELEKIYEKLDSYDYSRDLMNDKKNCDIIGDIDQLHQKLSDRLSDIFQESQKILAK